MTMRHGFRALLVVSAMAVVALLSAGAAHGGTWSSGGGEILEHAQNPWFLSVPTDPTPVTYCIAIGDDFPIDSDDLQIVVQSALRFWDTQLGNAHHPENVVAVEGRIQRIRLYLKTSQFRYQPTCSADTDLAFQFGYLTPEQEVEFRRLQVNLTRYVALTIRTDYSRNLRGKGFIYVSPDRGPRAFTGQNIVPEAWTNNLATGRLRLESVIKHELGHIFGLAHAQTHDALMSARFAEMIVSQMTVDSAGAWVAAHGGVFFPTVRTLPSFGGFCEEREIHPAFRAAFQIPANWQCVRARLDLNALIIDAAENRDAPWVRIGSARFADGGQRRHQQLVTLWLPRDQTAFPNLPSYMASLMGPASSEVQNLAMFINAQTHASQPIMIQSSARFMQVGAVVDGVLIPDLLPGGPYTSFSGWKSE